MKVTFKKETLNPNSIEKRDLYLRDKYVGQYDYGVYSKIVLLKAKKQELLPDYENFICGMIHKYFNIEIDNKHDIEKAEKICIEKENCSLINWINDELKKLGDNYVPTK